MSLRELIRYRLTSVGIMPREEDVDAIIASGYPLQFVDALVQLEREKYTAYVVKAFETLRGTVEKKEDCHERI